MEIRVPVTFPVSYFAFRSVAAGGERQCLLRLCPLVRPTLPPAINTGLMEKQGENGWARFDKNQRLDELERDMTGMLVKHAKSQAHLNLVREQCRKSVAEFVKNWLIQKSQWTNTFDAIVVVFPG